MQLDKVNMQWQILCMVYGLFVPWTIRTLDYSYHRWTVHTLLDCSYHGLFVPSLDFSYLGLFNSVHTLDCSYPPGLFIPWTIRTVPGLFVPWTIRTLDCSYQHWTIRTMLRIKDNNPRTWGHTPIMLWMFRLFQTNISLSFANINFLLRGGRISRCTAGDCMKTYESVQPFQLWSVLPLTCIRVSLTIVRDFGR